MMNAKRNQAIVIGGSVAGLLAARVLSDHFEQVTVIERDVLPDEGAYRAGVPQAHHLHTLLVRGQQIMEQLFPGFTDDLIAAGAPTAMWGRDNAFLLSSGWTGAFDSGITSNVCARAELEWLLRRRVYAIPNIYFLTQREVSHLIADESGKIVTGVAVESRVDHTSKMLEADLIVDASGRNSKAPEWLRQLGYDAPEETMINAHCSYATRWFEGNDYLKLVAVGIQTQPNAGLYRGGAALKVEGNRWVVTLLGANGDYPPTDEAEFMAYARSLASPVLYDLMRSAKPISPIQGYRMLENRMRHYERLARRPEQFIVTGDAACAFNPIYGQGMSAAAVEALELDGLLKRYEGRGLEGLAAQFQKKLYQFTQGPWMMATAEDLRYPTVEGDKPSFMSRLSNRYFDLMARAMPFDHAVTRAFFEGMNLLRSPQSLMNADVLLRVLWHNLIPHHDIPTRSDLPQIRDAEIASEEVLEVA